MEVWKPVEGFEEYYAVSNLGNVRNTVTEVAIVGDKNNMGYRRVTFYYGQRVRVFVHRLVAKHFCDGYAPDLVVNHIDGNKGNNRADNLEWVTRSENDKHAVALGLKSPGNKQPVVNIDTTTGLVLEVFDSIAEVTRRKRISQWVTHKHCQDHFVDANGVMWRYA
jgi:hypothetical protein